MVAVLPTRRDRPAGFEALSGDLQAELVEAAERGHMRAGEGTVGHVEVFRVGGVGTSILGRPRPLPRQRRARHDQPGTAPPAVKSPKLLDEPTDP